MIRYFLVLSALAICAFAHLQMGTNFPSGMTIGGDSNCSMCHEMWRRNQFEALAACNFHGVFNLETNVCDCFCDADHGCFTSISFCTVCDTDLGWTTEPYCMTDVQAPALTVVGDNPLTHEAGGPYVDPGATAWDNRDLDVTSTIVADASAVNVGVPDAYTVYYSVTDEYGNTATAQRTVNVVDTTPPTFELVGDATVTIEANYGVVSASAEPYADDGIANVADNSALSLTNELNHDVQMRVPGSYSATWSVTDSSENVATLTRTVVVVDTVGPTATLIGDASIQHPWLAEYVDAGVTCLDNADPTPTLTTVSNVDANTLGNYTVEHTCTDEDTGLSESTERAVEVILGQDGSSQAAAGDNCTSILENLQGRGETATDGVYWIDPNGGDKDDAVEVFCDMSIDGGGWTVIVANGELDDETADASCYPLISPSTAGCGDPSNLMNDFSLVGNQQAGLVWSHMVAVAYGSGGWTSKLAYFGISWSTAQATANIRESGSQYNPSGLSNRMYCNNAGLINSYCEYGIYNTYNPSPFTVRVGVKDGTVFGTGSMNSGSRFTFGFTDIYDHSGQESVYGVDDFQDGWSCGDNWTPLSVRGSRMLVMVR